MKVINNNGQSIDMEDQSTWLLENRPGKPIHFDRIDLKSHKDHKEFVPELMRVDYDLGQ